MNNLEALREQWGHINDYIQSEFNAGRYPVPEGRIEDFGKLLAVLTPASGERCDIALLACDPAGWHGENCAVHVRREDVMENPPGKFVS